MLEGAVCRLRDERLQLSRSLIEGTRMVGDTVAVADALARLHAFGLIHKIENLVCASRAAAHVHSLTN